MSALPKARGQVALIADASQVGKPVGEVARGESDATVTEIAIANGGIRLVTVSPALRGGDHGTLLDHAVLGTVSGNAALEEALGKVKPDVAVLGADSLRTGVGAAWGGDNAEAARITESLRPIAERLGVEFRVFDPGSVPVAVVGEPVDLDPYVAPGLGRKKVARLDIHKDDVHSLILAFTGGPKVWRGGDVATGGLVQLDPISKTVAQIRGTVWNRLDRLDRQYKAEAMHLTAAQWLGDVMTEVKGCALVLIDAGVLEAATSSKKMDLDPRKIAKTYDVAVAVVRS